MNILFSAEAFPHADNQFAAFIKVLCEEFVRQGHEVTVVAPQSFTRIIAGKSKRLPTVVSYDVDNYGIIKVIRPLSITTGYGRYGKYSWVFNKKSFERAVKKYQISFDIIYAHFWSCAYNALDVAIKHRKPLFVATGEDSINIERNISLPVVHKLRDTVKGVICVSTKNKLESVNLELAYPDQCIVLPNSVNEKEFYVKSKSDCRLKLHFPQDAFIVAFCGRFTERKGVMRVSEAIKTLNNSTIKSIFIGQNVEGQLVQPDCEGILFKGRLPHEEIVNYLNASDVFVLPSLAEGCSNSIVEAMACGLPIISSALPFNDDICSEFNSILIDPMDVKAISEAIGKMMDVSLRERLSKGSVFTASNLTIKERTIKIIDFIELKLRDIRNNYES